jgi:hypothetical protein
MRPGRCTSARRRTFSSELWSGALLLYSYFRGLPQFLLSVIPGSGGVLKYLIVMIMCSMVLRCYMIRFSAMLFAASH